jgi:Transposase IS4
LGITDGVNKKNVQVVQQLCEPFRGSYRTIYVNRFYSSIDLLKELEDMKLYTTGTIMSNRIPRDMTIAKSSKQFKELNRGDVVKNVLHYKTMQGEKKQVGLVAWKNMVFCLTNDTSTIPLDECRRRGQALLSSSVQRLFQSTTGMGGVDVADMRRLRCNSTVMGQNRWWLKLFFYLLDAGTSNALIVYNEAMQEKQHPYNIVDDKSKVVEALVGDKIKTVVGNIGDAHHSLISIPNGERQRCIYCFLLGKQCRTRFMCDGCRVPYCSIGSGNQERIAFPFLMPTIIFAKFASNSTNANSVVQQREY